MGTCPRYSLVVNEDVKKPNKPTNFHDVKFFLNISMVFIVTYLIISQLNLSLRPTYIIKIMIIIIIIIIRRRRRRRRRRRKIIIIVIIIIIIKIMII